VWVGANFGPIIQSFVLSMLHTRQDLAFGRSRALQVIRADHAWHIVQSLEELAEKLLGSMLVALALDQDIQHVAVLIDRSPQIVSRHGSRGRLHPSAPGHHNAEAAAMHWRRSAQTSGTTAEPFHRSRQSPRVNFDIKLLIFRQLFWREYLSSFAFSGNFSETGPGRASPINRIITKKSTA
jgi:hypothetical protein